MRMQIILIEFIIVNDDDDGERRGREEKGER